MIRYAPDGDFWDAVVGTHWQREALLFACEPQDAPFTPQSVFDAVTADSGRDSLDWVQVALSDSPSRVRDYQTVPFRQAGPRTADKDFAGYFARMAGTSFGFNVHDLGRRNPSLLPVAALFAERLEQLPDTPPIKRWELDCFAGTYRATPFGIHQDNGGVFSFCMHGRRTYLLWPDEYFEPGHPDLTRPDSDIIARHADAATRYDVVPGLGLYWPPTNWHVVLGDGSPFVVAQVSAYFDVR